MLADKLSALQEVGIYKKCLRKAYIEEFTRITLKFLLVIFHFPDQNAYTQSYALDWSSFLIVYVPWEFLPSQAYYITLYW